MGFNEKMPKLKELFELVASTALINRIKEHALWRKLYVLPYKILLKVKQDMKNYIHVKEISVLWHRLSCFYKDNQHEKLLKQNHSTNKEKSSRKN